MRSWVEAGLVSSSTAFLLCELCVVLSQQRRFKSGCWSYPTKGVHLAHSLLMKLPFCCCRCCLFCEQTVGENFPVFKEGRCSLGDSLTVGGIFCVLGCQRGVMYTHGCMYVYIYAHCWNTIPLTKDPVLFQDCDDPSHRLMDIY